MSKNNFLKKFELKIVGDFGDFRSDYLGEYDAVCKTVLAC
jgi:hypothetical protein